MVTTDDKFQNHMTIIRSFDSLKVKVDTESEKGTAGPLMK